MGNRSYLLNPFGGGFVSIDHNGIKTPLNPCPALTFKAVSHYQLSNDEADLYVWVEPDHDSPDQVYAYNFLEKKWRTESKHLDPWDV